MHATTTVNLDLTQLKQAIGEYINSKGIDVDWTNIGFYTHGPEEPGKPCDQVKVEIHRVEAFWITEGEQDESDGDS